MSKQFRYKAKEVESGQTVEGYITQDENGYLKLQSSPNKYSDVIDPSTIQRFVHEENDKAYFTGDLVAIYSEYYSSYDEALDDNEACVSEVDDCGLVILSHEEVRIPISNLNIAGYKFHIITKDYEKVFEG